MVKISITEFRRKMSYYLSLSETEDILIMKNNKEIAALSNPHKHAFYEFLSFADSLPTSDNSKSYEELLEEALLEKNGCL